MKGLVAGADGFIGSHLIESPGRIGHDVRVFLLHNSFNSWGWLHRCASVKAGIYVLEPGALDALSPGDPKNMPSPFSRLHARAQHTKVYPMHEPWVDAGPSDDLRLAGLSTARESQS